MLESKRNQVLKMLTGPAAEFLPFNVIDAATDGDGNITALRSLLEEGAIEANPPLASDADPQHFRSAAYRRRL